MPDKLIIKKYNNRRLYDTEKNVYVTLNQVAKEIKQGREVEVVDAKTKEDVTAFILTQILLEEAKTKNFLLPVPILHLMIRLGDTMLSEFFEKHLPQIIENYLSLKTSMDKEFEKWLDLSLGITDQAKKSFTTLSPLKSILDLMPVPREEKIKKGKKKK